MFVQRLDHVTILTRDLAASVAFYEQVLGLREGPRPPFGFAGVWIYSPAQPLIHLIDLAGDPEGGLAIPPGSGCIDHIALRCQNRVAFEEQLRERGQPYRSAIVPETGEYQIFLRDPVNRVGIECVFAAEEAGA